MKVDLHIHSTISDGSDTIEQIVETAKQCGLDAIAITDHDTLAHQAHVSELEARLGAELEGMKIICGVELSAIHKNTRTRTHILGYGIQKPEVITEFTQALLEARNKNSEKQVEVLRKLGYKIDKDQLPRADKKYLYKQHIMDWLVTTGQAPDMFGDFYYQTFKNGGPCAFDIEHLDVFEAIQTIKKAGGLAVLAHPGQQQNFWLIPELVACGLDGLELNHHSHSEKDREIVRDYAQRYGLFLTGGSDYHGIYEPQEYGIGDFLSDESGVAKILPLA
ncbi:MAG: PHP domain-containing protein [Coriobacteriia bacterium]|nr:PHP domain-containing protein [Coriobacteriia bacterium]